MLGFGFDKTGKHEWIRNDEIRDAFLNKTYIPEYNNTYEFK